MCLRLPPIANRTADLGQQVRTGQIATGLVIPPNFKAADQCRAVGGCAGADRWGGCQYSRHRQWLYATAG